MGTAMPGGEGDSNQEETVSAVTVSGAEKATGAIWATSGVNSGIELNTQVGVARPQHVPPTVIIRRLPRMGMSGPPVPAAQVKMQFLHRYIKQCSDFF